MVIPLVNVIREALKQRVVGCQYSPEPTVISDEIITRSPRLSQISQLHSVADARCQQFARLVVAIVRRHLGTSFFRYDASLVRDGCFFAGLLLAGDSGTDEEINTCLQALREMRWAFSKSEEREHTLNMVWERRITAESLVREDAELRQSTCNAQHDSPSGRSPFTSLSSRPSMISGASSYGTHSYRSASGSSPFVHAAQTIESTLMLGALHVNEPLMSDMDTFAHSIVPSTSGSPLRSPHDFTPPCSSPGMTTSSVIYEGPYFDSTGTQLFTVSPPGSVQGPVDTSLPSDKSASYLETYNVFEERGESIDVDDEDIVGIW